MTALGIDIVSINRVETFVARWHTRALERFLTKHEISLYAGNVQRIASAWAAKEAFSKARGGWGWARREGGRTPPPPAGG